MVIAGAPRVQLDFDPRVVVALVELNDAAMLDRAAERKPTLLEGPSGIASEGERVQVSIFSGRLKQARAMA